MKKIALLVVALSSAPVAFSAPPTEASVGELNLPALPGHPVKRIPFATEVFHEQTNQAEEVRS